jgi:hypothetical protein
LTQTVGALIDHPTGTILGIRRMLTDWRYRQSVLDYVSDPETIAVWTGPEFRAYRKSNSGEALTPVLNKVGEFVASPNLRNIVGQTKSTINFRTIMDDSLIFIANLSEGAIGDRQSRLLGSFIRSGFAQAAYARIDVPKNRRRPFVLILDEFPNFVDASFAKHLSELRKYHLSFVFAHQYLAQLDSDTVEGIKGNVENFITFQQGIEDAEQFLKVFDRDMKPAEFIDLFPHEAWARLQTQDEAGLCRWRKKIETAQWDEVASHGYAVKIIEQSRMKFGAPYQFVAKRVAQRLAS